MKGIMNICQTGNVAQTRQFVTNRFNDDIKKGLLKNLVSCSNFKLTMPIIIHNKSYKINNIKNKYIVECSLFNNQYQKDNNLKRLHFEIDQLNNNLKSTLNKIINKEYKQGSMQITQDEKGKWYLIISFSFENHVEKQLNTNRILGVDLGVTNMGYE